VALERLVAALERAHAARAERIASLIPLAVVLLLVAFSACR